MCRSRCRHFTGLGSSQCKAGVDYQKLAGPEIGMALRLPCIQLNTKPVEGQTKVLCELFEVETPEDLERERKENEEEMRRIRMIEPMIQEIKTAYAGSFWKGYRDCPVCVGRIRIEHAQINGHTRGQCETSGCVNWIE